MKESLPKRVVPEPQAKWGSREANTSQKDINSTLGRRTSSGKVAEQLEGNAGGPDMGGEWDTVQRGRCLGGQPRPNSK